MDISNVNAMNSYTNQLNQNADKLAQTTTNAVENGNSQVQSVDQTEETNDLGRILTDNISIENGFDAQVRSIQTQDEVLGTLFDARS